MKKSDFAALILGTIGGVCFSLGMCMALVPGWGMPSQGAACGVAGLAILLAALAIWRKMEHKAPIRLNAKMLMAVFIGMLGALLLGVGMCMVTVFAQMAWAL